jgi:hypothetical protein
VPPFESKYFELQLDEEAGEECFVYGTKRDYWVDRRKQDFAHMEDIF